MVDIGRHYRGTFTRSTTESEFAIFDIATVCESLRDHIDDPRFYVRE